MSSQSRLNELEKKLEEIDEKLKSIQSSEGENILSIQQEINKLSIDCKDIAVSNKFMELFKRVSIKISDMLDQAWVIYKKPDSDKVLAEIQQTYYDGDHINFQLLGSKVSEMFAIPPTINFFGSTEETIVEESLQEKKTVTRRRSNNSVRSPQSEPTRPLQVIERENHGDKHLSRLGKRLKKQCEKTNQTPFINALTSDTFSKTVEQLFDAAIIVNKGELSLGQDKDNIPVLKMNQKEENLPINHIIFSTNSKAYKKLGYLSGNEKVMKEGWESQ